MKFSASCTNNCYADSAGLNGFRCSSWQATTYDLTKVDLRLKNSADKSIIGCMSPGNAISADTRWGGLGIGASCAFEDPSVTDVGLYIPNPVYLDASLMYGNPYSDDQISGYEKIDLGNSGKNGQQYRMAHAWWAFCAKYSDFCTDPQNPGRGRSGLAHLIGRAGPLRISEYLSLVKKLNPTGYYTWQYDDKATVTCDLPNSKAMAVFCPDASTKTFPQDLTGSRFAVYNNCNYDIWVQTKSVAAFQNNPALCHTPPILGTDCLFYLPKSGGSHLYNTPEKGLQSVNLWSKTGCDTSGYNCKTGEINAEQNPQPDIETKIEATFGCTTGSGCSLAKNGTPLGNSSFYDVSFVDGFTRPAQIQVFKAPGETNVSCNSLPLPNLDLAQCPSATDLSNRP